MGVNGNCASISVYANDMPEYNTPCSTICSNNPVLIYFDNSSVTYEPDWAIGDDGNFYLHCSE